MKINTLVFAASLSLFSGCALANGDTLHEVCYQSMMYSISTQVAGNPINNDARLLNITGAFVSGKWLGVDRQSTERMIKMASQDSKSREFANRYQNDSSFAEAFRNSFISGCHENPREYVIN
ncbi:hypothetical protein [Kosakonia cowanii]|uniref:hypothetical protein n=1 Tax=Kosakonia cowanii TaxID=208223 RepID=UPI00289BE9F0|nr:hypothetical protein [Kosakonia cowanii]